VNVPRRHVLLTLLKLVDIALACGAYLLATFLTQTMSSAFTFQRFLAMRVSVGNLVLFMLWLTIWHISFLSFGLYNSRRLSGRSNDARDTAKACSVGVLIIGSIAVTANVRMISARFLVAFWVISITASILHRVVLRSTLARIRVHGRNLRNLLIVGTSDRAIQFASSLQESPELGYRILGFVDDDWAGLAGLNASGFSRVADFAGISEFLRKQVVDEVLIALPMGSFHSRATQIAAICEEQGITIRVLTNLFNLRASNGRDRFDDAVLITHPVASGWPIVVKRGFDILVSSLLLVLCAPVLVIVAILIKLTSPGPVFFRQYRVGLYKRPFRMIKIRTMVADAEKVMRDIEHLNEVSGPVFKIKNDPRITPLGRFLRKASIDELPQLINVLKGDMSLVGPRPLPLRDYEGFREDWHRRRFTVRPGITCLWQIAGRSSIPFEKWMQLDLQYIDNWSLWLDMKILAGTIPVVLRGSGAA
jgi:exopolysaccharide biosynthesis polyprenyl glycosylphosphotransferase